MYFKLAYQNVKKSYRDFMIYFLTLAFSVCLFYTFNSFQQQKEVLSLNEMEHAILETTGIVMNFLSIFVAIVFAFLILYANRFLIKRRKQEFGLYKLLGMPNGKIDRILVYETVLIGLISLVAGMMLGIALSQCLSILTASLFEVELNYHFIFSWGATIATILLFALIFTVTIILNSFEINRFKLIDLLQANQKHQQSHLQNLYLSVFLFLVSLGLLGYAYYLSSRGAYLIDTTQLQIMLVCGLAGTFLLFFSLSGFLLKFIQSSKRFYYRKLNMFVLRQLNANINSNFFSMSIISILLLLSIGALSTGFSLRESINSTVILSTPYDASISIDGLRDPDAAVVLEKDFFEEIHYFHVYKGEPVNTLAKYAQQETTQTLLKNVSSYTSIQYVKLSEFNQFLRHIGEEELTLGDKEGYAFSSTDMVHQYLADVMSDKPVLSVYGTSVRVKAVSEQLYNGYTTPNMGVIAFGIVVPDNLIPADAPLNLTAINLTPKDKESIEWRKSVYQSVQDTLENTTEDQLADGAEYWAIDLEGKEDVRRNTVGLSTVFTYIGLYLGTVFLIACSVMLALQQLSSASSDQQRYRTLVQLGCERRMINHAVLLQISLYFIIPLIVGMIHSFFGIRFVSDIVQLFGRLDIFTSSAYTAAILVIIYGSYFYITYLGYRSIIHSKS